MADFIGANPNVTAEEGSFRGNPQRGGPAPGETFFFFPSNLSQLAGNAE